MYDEVDLK